VSKTMNKKKGTALSAVKLWLNEHNIIYAVVFLAIILTFVSRKFLTLDNMMNILRQTSMVAIIAVGAFYTIVGGGIDLSSGAVAGISGIMFAKMVAEWRLSPLVAIVLTMLFGCILGIVNAATAAFGGIPPFIATLGMQIACRGLCFVITNAYPVTGIPDSIDFIGRGYLWVFPIPVLISIVVFLIMSFIANKTRFGRSVYAVGSNEDAAHFSGINTKLVKATTFVIAGLMASVAAIILTSRVESGQPNGGLGWELDAITAAAIGGVSITGGRGNLFGVFLGALFVGMLTNGMTLMNMNSYHQQIVEGIVLVLAIGIDVFRTNRASRV